MPVVWLCRGMEVEIWVDVVCPWCYVGKRRWEAALADFPHRDEVEVTWRSFELAPDAPASSDQSLVEMLSSKYGVSVDQAVAMNDRVSGVAAEEGLDYQLERARPANTFDAHRLLHLAGHRGLAEEAEERLFRAYFTEGVRIGDRDALVRLASEIGLDVDEVREVLDGDRYAADVRDDEETARSLGISGVPFVAIDRKFGVSGAQPVEAFRNALDEAWAAREPA